MWIYHIFVLLLAYCAVQFLAFHVARNLAYFVLQLIAFHKGVRMNTDYTDEPISKRPLLPGTCVRLKF